ncbi:histidine--tRNA ligase [Frisingicoccus sp.]|uniref:histidine--tRNA ligase n=1 Tax=Frisingicoccus sp. TaxID=1918627 RepID=UPI0025BB4C16|nr:histidine--tRNA ligase [Frisingicoccus sp.]MDD6232215.1 histidine--tRNA ligase [Frisingicoccus sp.]MDY4835005.1 histidine--tRNA ligase [Frisingicoccus sp.]MDY4921754.1 histidine--tRNA ligase [Frisingicoccus sp.]
MITQRPKGTQDWYGSDMHKRTIIEAAARELCKVFNIKEVITPVFEHTVLFQRGVGETTDVVQKEMYTFEDKGHRSITLKPEGTAGAIRAYLENNMYAEPAPTKLFYVTPAFRYEQPQSGRLRQHHQFGVEFVGSKSPLVEVELITLITTLIRKIGLKDAKLHINSIGCANCRKTYNEALLAYLKQHEEHLCPTCRERMKKNPLRVIDCKVPECKEIVKDAPRTIEYLDDECREHFEELQKLLTEMNIPFEIDTGIVRGLDYYTKTVFEFVNSDGFTLCGGGRYDNLVHEIDEKQNIPSVGFGMGLERILYFLEKEQVELEPEPGVELYVGILGKEARAQAYQLVNTLRMAGIIVETDYMDRSVKAQMKYANKLGAKYTVILGENELKENSAKIKNMETGEQTEVALDAIAAYFIK